MNIWTWGLSIFLVSVLLGAFLQPYLPAWILWVFAFFFGYGATHLGRKMGWVD